jgi:hypothetical protein
MMIYDVTETIQIEGPDISFNECVMVLYVTMFKDRKLRRMADGDIIPFDFIWNDVLEMETDDPEMPDNTARSIMRRRFEEIKLEHPEKTSIQVLQDFRDTSEELYNLIRHYATNEC